MFCYAVPHENRQKRVKHYPSSTWMGNVMPAVTLQFHNNGLSIPVLYCLPYFYIPTLCFQKTSLLKFLDQGFGICCGLFWRNVIAFTQQGSYLLYVHLFSCQLFPKPRGGFIEGMNFG